MTCSDKSHCDTAAHITNWSLFVPCSTVWDASAKQAVGLLSGNRYQLGDFDECLQVVKPIKAQYCLVDIKIDVPYQYSYADPLTREYDPLLPAWLKIYVSWIHFFSACKLKIKLLLIEYLKYNNVNVIHITSCILCSNS